MSQVWAHIEDLHSPNELLHKELAALALVWSEQRQRLATQEAYIQFQERLMREWAIETRLGPSAAGRSAVGERLYSFDRGITQLLIDHGIQAAVIPHGNRSRAAFRIPKPPLQ